MSNTTVANDSLKHHAALPDVDTSSPLFALGLLYREGTISEVGTTPGPGRDLTQPHLLQAKLL